MRYAIFIFLTGVTSCSKENGKFFEEPSEVYVAGAVENNGKPSAAYWKNGKLKVLPSDGTFSYVSSIFVSNDDIYLAGSSSDRDVDDDPLVNNTPVLWKNGLGSPLPIPDSVELDYRISIKSLDLVGSDVYVFAEVTDHLMNNPGINVSPLLWKNSQLVPLDNLVGRWTGSICIAGGEIFIAVGKGFWRNGLIYEIEDANGVGLIEVVGGLIYAAGWDKNFIPGYWLNGSNFVPLELPNQELYGIYLIDIKISDGNVYILGNRNKETIVWKNGLIESNLDNSDPSAFSIYGNTILISGNKDDEANDYFGVYWIVNDIVRSKRLTDCEYASSIFIR